MRTKLIHDYFEIDENEVWKTAERDIAMLQEQIEILAKEYSLNLNQKL